MSTSTSSLEQAHFMHNVQFCLQSVHWVHITVRIKLWSNSYHEKWWNLETLANRDFKNAWDTLFLVGRLQNLSLKISVVPTKLVESFLQLILIRNVGQEDEGCLSVSLPHTTPENANLVFALNEEIALFNPTTLTETNTEMKNTLPTVDGRFYLLLKWLI